MCSAHLGSKLADDVTQFAEISRLSVEALPAKDGSGTENVIPSITFEPAMPNDLCASSHAYTLPYWSAELANTTNGLFFTTPSLNGRDS